MNPSSPVPLLCCGIFARELRSIDRGLRDRIDPVFLDSMLHMRPALLEKRLGEAIEGVATRGALMVYGDCCPHMSELCSAADKPRTRGINCIEIALGSLRYRELRRDGAFFFMPEWLQRWQEVFVVELGFAEMELARTFMN